MAVSAYQRTSRLYYFFFICSSLYVQPAGILSSEYPYHLNCFGKQNKTDDHRAEAGGKGPTEWVGVPAPHLGGPEDGAPHLLAVVPHAIYSHVDG